MRVLFAVASWGLGHATRDLALLRALLAEGHEVTIISSERAMQLLKHELGDACSYVDVPDIPKPLSRKPALFYLRMSISLPLVFWTHWWEHQVTLRLHRSHRFDRVVSDTRYGVCLKDVPSYHLVHSLRQIIPGRPKRLETMVEIAQKGLLSGARKIIIPDLAGQGLAGELCHHLACDWNQRLEYIGILSSVGHATLEAGIDFFISVSGAEPQRTIFERIALEQAADLPGRVVVALGRPDLPLSVSHNGRVTIYSYLGRQQQAEMMNRARLVVSRSGYTTLMELAELNKRALLIPTPGQSEQEYLGDYHEQMGTMHSVRQGRVRLRQDAEIAAGYSGISLQEKTRESTARFLLLLQG